MCIVLFVIIMAYPLQKEKLKQLSLCSYMATKWQHDTCFLYLSLKLDHMIINSNSAIA